MDLSYLAQETRYCEHVNEHSAFIKGATFLHQADVLYFIQCWMICVINGLELCSVF